MIPVQEAKAIINKHIFQLDSETILLSDSSGRVIDHDVIATFPSPRFDNSAMDGFAIRSIDTKGASQENPVLLRNIGSSMAGSPSSLHLKSGECIQCMTGAKIPSGADAVIMVEQTSGFSDNELIKVMADVSLGKNIRLEGEEIKNGDILIRERTRITASELSVCAAFGYGQIKVIKQPKVAIFATGNELIEPGKELKEGKIYNSNLYMFSELVQKSGGKVIMQNVVKDDKKALHSFLSEALDHCDLIISSGGVSMGRYDYVRDVFMDLGVKEHFWKVAQKPGKPLFFGSEKNKLVFGLPGNPISSYIGFMEWVWPVIGQMMGYFEDPYITGILKKPFQRDKIKFRYLFGNAWTDKGKILCEPSTKVGSHMLTSALGANCILGANPGAEDLIEGDAIQVNLLPWADLK